MTRREVADRVTTDTDCACDPSTGAMCLLHYGQLPLNRRIGVRHDLGIGGHMERGDRSVAATRVRDAGGPEVGRSA